MPVLEDVYKVRDSGVTQRALDHENNPGIAN